MGIDIYKIPEDHSAAVGQTKNEHEKDNEKKRTFLYEMVNSGYIDKYQVDNFVKRLKLVLVYRMFYKKKP